MTTAAHHHRPVRLLAAASGSLILILALPAAASAAPGGTWGTAQEVPGTAALNRGGDAEITSVSCARAGDCSAGGGYQDASGFFQVFVAGEARGVWGKAQQVPGTAALNQRGFAEITSVSCAKAGDCSAGGSYLDASRHLQAFVVNET
jgi:hypothetical protein